MEEQTNLENPQGQSFESLLNDNQQPASLINGDPAFGFDSNLLANSETSDMEKSQKMQEKAQMQAQLEETARIRELSKPEVQARIVADNYINSSPIKMNGPERKRIYRECLKNARLGKYKSYFIPEFIAKREERERAKLAKLNQQNPSAAKTIDDLTPEMKDKLMEMANVPESEVPKSE